MAVPAHAAFPGQNGKIAFYNGASSTRRRLDDESGRNGSGFPARRGRAVAVAGRHRVALRPRKRRPSHACQRQQRDGRAHGNYQAFHGTLYFDPTWSPDARIAATLEDILETDNPDYSVWAPGVGVVTGEDPTWRPDGVEIAYVNRFGTADTGGIRASRVLDGTGRRTIVADNGDPVQTHDPDFSPDGSKIACEIGGDIHVIPTTGGTPAPLTNDPASDDSPAWSPDGTKIAFTSYRDGNAEIYVMNADGFQRDAHHERRGLPGRTGLAAR